MSRRFRGLTVLALFAGLCGGSAVAQAPPVKPKNKFDERRNGVAREGSPAPDFELKTIDGKKTVRLSSFRGTRPVALIFGSYT